MRRRLWILLLGLTLCPHAVRAERVARIKGAAGAVEPRAPVNKLLYMNRLYYLPFSVDFQVGKTPDDVLPFLDDKYGQPDRLLSAEELERLEGEWNAIKDSWASKSLLLTTPVGTNQSVHITNHLVSHHVPLTRSALDNLSIPDQIQVTQLLNRKPPEVRADFRQLQFLKSFLKPLEEERFNFFVVSASWCESCRQYRVILETYMKTFPDSGLNLHSVVVQDPREEIFESSLLKELFPNPQKYSQFSIPRFLALQTTRGKTQVWEEGEALEALYNRFYKDHRGFLDSKSTLFRTRTRATIDPTVSWVAK